MKKQNADIHIILIIIASVYPNFMWILAVEAAKKMKRIVSCALLCLFYVILFALKLSMPFLYLNLKNKFLFFFFFLYCNNDSDGAPQSPNKRLPVFTDSRTKKKKNDRKRFLNPPLSCQQYANRLIFWGTQHFCSLLAGERIM